VGSWFALSFHILNFLIVRLLNQELDVVCEILPTEVDAGPESRGGGRCGGRSPPYQTLMSSSHYLY